MLKILIILFMAFPIMGSIVVDEKPIFFEVPVEIGSLILCRARSPTLFDRLIIESAKLCSLVSYLDTRNFSLDEVIQIGTCGGCTPENKQVSQDSRTWSYRRTRSLI